MTFQTTFEPVLDNQSQDTMTTAAYFVLKGTEASLEVYSDWMEIKPTILTAKLILNEGRELIFYKDVSSIAVREIGIFKSGYIEFGVSGIMKRSVAYDYADLNSLALEIRAFVLKQVRR